MKSKIRNPGPITAILVLTVAFVASCVAGPVNWTGSVDAVFKYKAKQKSTVIHKIRPDSYSERAGLKAGDIILAVDGNDLSNSSYDMVRAALRGPVGTFAVLTVKRGETIIDVKVERKPVKTSSGNKND